MSEIIGYMPLLMEGLLITLEIFALTLIFSLPLGLPIALGEECRFKPLAYLCRAYVWVFRGTPLMLQLFFFYFFFPIVLNIRMAALPTAILTFILNYAAYFAEIYRGGFRSIDRGQHEAAFALGLSKSQTMFGILLPQTMKAILPPVFNEVITLVKDTALVMSIGGVADLMKNANSIVNRTSQITPLVVAGAIYLILTFLITIGANRIERYFARYDQRGDQ